VVLLVFVDSLGVKAPPQERQETVAAIMSAHLTTFACCLTPKMLHLEGPYAGTKEVRRLEQWILHPLQQQGQELASAA